MDYKDYVALIDRYNPVTDTVRYRGFVRDRYARGFILRKIDSVAEVIEQLKKDKEAGIRFVGLPALEAHHPSVEESAKQGLANVYLLGVGLGATLLYILGIIYRSTTA